MDMQISRVPRLGDFQMLPGQFYGQSQMKAEGVKNLVPDVFAHVNPLPSEAPAAPGAILPTQAPTYLFPTTTEQAPPATPAKGDDSTQTLLIVGGLVVVGVIAAVALTQ